jgi:glycosyltransferase involved in cell wall biosynthesis
MAGLAAALAARGVETTYVAERTLTPDRAELGWEVPSLGGAKLLFAPDEQAVQSAVAKATPDSLHLCQGLRANGMVGKAQRHLAERALRQWVIMESVDDHGWKGWLRRGLYRAHIRLARRRINAFLATGHGTTDWLIARGAPEGTVFPFTYFLSSQSQASIPTHDRNERFRIVFVGQFIQRKRLDLLIEAMKQIDCGRLELLVVGSGPLEQELRILAEDALGDRVMWLGRQPISAVADIMSSADCLVLPSEHDGWGAVASEAMIVGTRVICSDACGCREVVRLGGGDVFVSKSVSDLKSKLLATKSRGKQTIESRERLRSWALSLRAEAGASYLVDVVSYVEGNANKKPIAPWTVNAINSDGNNGA